MKPYCFVGIDTSNYTTSVAVSNYDGDIVANLKLPLPVKEGERGLRQSDALFAHTKNLPDLMEKLTEVLKDYTPIAVGCSDKPRDAEGSYMPCFLAGVAAAHSFAAPMDLPIYRFSHQDGHIKAAYYSSGADIGGDFAAFHVSGGTTELVYVKKNDTFFSVELMGETNDLNAGQCIDRTGVMMGLKFPCGAEMDKLALEFEAKLPPIKTAVKDMSCNLSGLENLTQKLYRETEDKRLVSAFAFEYIAKSLYKMTDALREKYPNIPIIYAGGVMSSVYIGERLRYKRNGVYFAKPAFSADNAAGVALLCREKYLKERS
ncbi:MAG: peptidase M22 [Ruminococcaceae bacterium]|nr:peptidase M22 [Oscillospiraceae bacterium]